MTSTQPTSSQPSEELSNTCPIIDRTHPDQQEVTAILSAFNKDPKHLSIISLGRDGVLRNLTADRDVLDAVRLSPRLVKAFLDRVPPAYRALTPEIEDVDGSGVSEEQLWHPDKGLLPPPMEEGKKVEALKSIRVRDV
jgi:hypothetical protein